MKLTLVLDVTLTDFFRRKAGEHISAVISDG